MSKTEDEVVLVTGATDGLGKEVARELAAAGATVLLHGRDADRGAATLAEFGAATGSDRLVFYQADLAALAEVRRLAERLLVERERLTVLVNNAGVGRGAPGAPRSLSADGHELRFAVNYLAPALLTRLLAPLLVRSAPARVVNVASAAQQALDLDDPMLEHGYDGSRAYAQSKLALVMLTLDLAEQFRGSGVTVNCLHPATRMPTKLVAEAGARAESTLADGTAATLRLITDPDPGTGNYYDRLDLATAHPQAYDPEARKRLHRLMESILDTEHALPSWTTAAARAEAAASP